MKAEVVVSAAALNDIESIIERLTREAGPNVAANTGGNCCGYSRFCTISQEWARADQNSVAAFVSASWRPIWCFTVMPGGQRPFCVSFTDIEGSAPPC